MRNAVSVLCLASLMAIGAAAEGQQPAAQGQQPAAQAQQPAQPAAQGQKPALMQKVTISGCLQAAPPAPAGAPAAPAAAKFELANAKVVSGGPVGTSGATTTATSYRVDGEDKTISPHLDHQVELTGTISPAAPGSAAAAPLLKVESVKMVSAKCP